MLVSIGATTVCPWPRCYCRPCFITAPVPCTPLFHPCCCSEGGDSDTRRRAAADLVRALTDAFEAQVTELFTGYVGALLQVRWVAGLWGRAACRLMYHAVSPCDLLLLGVRFLRPPLWLPLLLAAKGGLLRRGREKGDLCCVAARVVGTQTSAALVSHFVSCCGGQWNQVSHYYMHPDQSAALLSRRMLGHVLSRSPLACSPMCLPKWLAFIHH